MNPPLLFSKVENGFYFITPTTSLEEAAKNLDAKFRISTATRIELPPPRMKPMPGHFLQLSIARHHKNFVRQNSELERIRRRLGLLRRKNFLYNWECTAMISTCATSPHNGNASAALAP